MPEPVDGHHDLLWDLRPVYGKIRRRAYSDESFSGRPSNPREPRGREGCTVDERTSPCRANPSPGGCAPLAARPAAAPLPGLRSEHLSPSFFAGVCQDAEYLHQKAYED